MRKLAIVLSLSVMATVCVARDLGQWADDPALAAYIKQWFATLMQPDNPNISCCGEADAYWADSFEASPDGEYIVTITDDRPNVGALAYRLPRAVGTKIRDLYT